MEKIQRAKNRASLTFSKTIFEAQILILAISECEFLKIDKNGSQLLRNHFYAPYGALGSTKR